MCTFHFINNHKWCQLFVFHSIGYWSAELWCIFLIAHPPHTKKANEDAETLDVQREYKTIKHRHRFFVHGKLEDCCYHIMIDQQKPMIIRVGSEDHKVTGFVQFVVKLGVWMWPWNLKKNSFVNGNKVFKLELIKLHQESNNHARAKCIVNPHHQSSPDNSGEGGHFFKIVI